nr:unnamed protein product [Callosobruchus chinensis]
MTIRKGFGGTEEDKID